MDAWTLDDIPWQAFDRARLDPDIVRLVKAASVIEYNGGAYARHLCLVFSDDVDFQTLVQGWGAEEIQHGEALARWAQMADPDFDFDASFARFQAGYRVDFDTDRSRRGSRSGEMIARCIVETGTSSYYTALREAAAEPVLQEICRHIAADELRHYRLFYKTLDHYLAREKVGRWVRVRIAFDRIAESGDDELAYAYYAANGGAPGFDRRRESRAYARRAMALYRPHHIERMVAMVLKTVGFRPNGRLGGAVSVLAWHLMRLRMRSLVRTAI